MLRRRSCGRLWNRQIRPQISSILIPVDGRPGTSLCVPLPVRQRDAQSLAAAVFCDPPTSPLCFVWGGVSPAESCVRRAPLRFLLLPTIISFPSYQRSELFGGRGGRGGRGVASHARADSIQWDITCFYYSRRGVAHEHKSSRVLAYCTRAHQTHRGTASRHVECRLALCRDPPASAARPAGGAARTSLGAMAACTTSRSGRDSSLKGGEQCISPKFSTMCDTAASTNSAPLCCGPGREGGGG